MARLFQISGIFAYPARLWNKGVRIIEVLLYIYIYIHTYTQTKLMLESLGGGLLRLPQLAMFKQGAFVGSITGREFYSVRPYKTNEMLISKECKGSIVQTHLRRTAHYLPYRAQSMQNFKAQILDDQKNPVNTINSPYSTQGSDLKYKGNVQARMDCIKNYKCFHRQQIKIEA